MRVRQWAHLPRHRSKTRSVTEADPTFEMMKGRRRKGLREYAQLPRLHSLWSFRHASKPVFPEYFFPALRRL